jgi:hypothetical protein
MKSATSYMSCITNLLLIIDCIRMKILPADIWVMQPGIAIIWPYFTDVKGYS